ncbi:MAG: YggT family protein [Treponemataceae bacterium]|nr:YggT family protein [Treponemataceae bacterium]
MLSALLRTLSSLVTAYALLVFVRVMITWFPSAQYSKAGQFLSNLCDPFLNLFRRIRFLRFGNLDFSPALAIGVLALASSFLQRLANGQRISIGMILSALVSICWSLAHSLLQIFVLILVIRLIVTFIDSLNSSPFFSSLDNFLSPMLYGITKKFAPNRFIKYQTTLIIGIAACVVIIFAGNILFGIICGGLSALPI